MLFASYWELNEETPVRDILEAGERLMESGLWPPEGVEIVRWDVTTDNWGLTVFEADSAEAADRVSMVWRLAVPGMFVKTVTAPASPSEETMASAGELLAEFE